MEDVATLAGVSKMTVYSHFQDKETLFESIVSSVSDAMMEALTPAGPAAPEAAGVPLPERLVAMGRAFLNLMLGPEIAALHHSLPGALRANRALGPRFYNAGPGRACVGLASMIEAAAARGELAIDDPRQAASDLISLWEGGLSAQIAFNVADAVNDAEIERRVRRGTAVFMKAYGVQPTQA